MDELDQERSTAQALAAAGAAAALFAGVALAITRKRGESEPIAAGVSGGTARRAPGEGAGHLAEQVAALAPEVLEVLEQHVPDSMRRLRDRLPGLGRPRADLPAVQAAAAERLSDLAEQVTERVEEGAAAAKRSGDLGQLDLSALTPAQATAARAAAAAVARAEQALGAVGTAGSRSRDTGQDAAEDIARALREVAHQAAETALDLWQQARGRVATVGDGETPGETAAHLAATVAEGAQGASEKAREAAAEAAARAHGVAHDVADKAHDLGDKAKKGARDAAETTVETGKESVSALAWLVAAIAVVVYVLLKPERRESLTRFANEAVVQAQELLRDLRGYDDEF